MLPQIAVPMTATLWAAQSHLATGQPQKASDKYTLPMQQFSIVLLFEVWGLDGGVDKQCCAYMCCSLRGTAEWRVVCSNLNALIKDGVNKQFK